MSIAKLMVFGPVDVSHSSSDTFEENCRTRDLWMLIGPVAGVTHLARLQNLPRPQSCCRSGPLLRNSRCPKPVEISGLRTETRLLRTHHILLIEERLIFRPAYYYAFETDGHVVKCHIFQLNKAGHFRD